MVEDNSIGKKLGAFLSHLLDLMLEESQIMGDVWYI